MIKIQIRKLPHQTNYTGFVTRTDADGSSEQSGAWFGPDRAELEARIQRWIAQTEKVEHDRKQDRFEQGLED